MAVGSITVPMKVTLMLVMASSILMPVSGEGTFNYETSGRVHDNVNDFAYVVSKMLEVPFTKITEYVVNVTNHEEAARSLFFIEKRNYASILSNVYVGLEDGTFYDYATDNTLPLNMFFGKAFPGTTTRLIYSVQKSGYPLALVRTNAYNVRGRPWYIMAKKIQIKYWTAPYIDAASGFPVVSLIYPLTNFTLHGKVMQYAGSLAADVPLQLINNFLSRVYNASDKNAFVIDKGSMSLIGSSLNALTYKTDPITLKKLLMPALDSENSIIVGATQLLINKGWPDILQIYGDKYLQSILYRDRIYGIEWYIVILIPAVLQADHIGTDSPLYAGVIAMGAITITVCVICLSLTLIFWKSKMMKLTQPAFTCVMIIGGILLGISALLLVGPNTTMSCGVRVFLFNLAFTIAFVPLLIKSFKVHLLFNVNPMAKKQMMSNSTMLLYTLCFVVVDVILLCTTLFINNRGIEPYTTTELTNNGAYAELTFCGYHDNFNVFYAEFVFKGILIAIGCYLSFVTRNVVGEISGSKTVLAIVYNTAVVAIVVASISTTAKEIESQIVTEAVGICFCVIVSSLLLVVPIVYQLVTIGDKLAAEVVMDEVMARTQKTSKINESIKEERQERERLRSEAVSQAQQGSGGEGNGKDAGRSKSVTKSMLFVSRKSSVEGNMKVISEEDGHSRPSRALNKSSVISGGELLVEDLRHGKEDEEGDDESKSVGVHRSSSSKKIHPMA